MRVAEDKGFGDIVSDEHHGLAQLLLQGFEFLLNTAPGDRIEGAEWLVQENHRRIGGQSARHTDPLALPAGKLARQSTGEAIGIEADQIQQLARPLREYDRAASLPAAARRRYFARWSDAETNRSLG